MQPAHAASMSHLWLVGARRAGHLWDMHRYKWDMLRAQSHHRPRPAPQPANPNSFPGIDASRRRVYGSRGLVKISSLDAASTSRPSFITQT